MSEHVMTILAHNARELAEGLNDVLREAREPQYGPCTLAEVYFEEPLRLRLVRERLTDGSEVLNLRL